MIKPNNINIAFTLSEVLITLVIIGVVAAITLPPLKEYHNQQDIKNHFKKMYSTVKQALYQSRFSLGYAPACYYKMVGSNADAVGTLYTSDCTELSDHLIKKLHILKECKTNSFADKCLPEYIIHVSSSEYSTEELKQAPAYIIQDGTILFFPKGYSVPVIGIDCNGFRGPNRGGKDVFTFRIGSINGSLLELRPDPNQFTESHGMSSDEMLQYVYTAK